MPGCSIQNWSAQALQLNGSGLKLSVGTRVEEEGSIQFTRNSYSCGRSAGNPRVSSCTCTMYSCVLVPGTVLPSRSAASIWLCVNGLCGAGTKNVTNCGAVAQASMAD